MSDERLEETLRRTYAHIDVWRRLADGEITDAQAQFLVGTGPDPNRAPSPEAPALKTPTGLKRQPRQQSEADKRRLEQRKGLAAGVLPPDLVGALTIADQAVAEVISRYALMKRGCTLSMASLANQAFVSLRTAQLAVRKLDDLRLIACFCRKRKSKDNDTNQIVVTSKRWLEHLRERAAVNRFRGVQKSTPKEVDKSTSELHDPKKQNGLSGRQHFLPLSLQADAWLKPFRRAAGDCLNPASILLRDPLPLTKLLVSGCTRVDLIAGIRHVAMRHSNSGRSGTIWSWDYFNQAIVAARARREARRFNVTTETIFED